MTRDKDDKRKPTPKPAPRVSPWVATGETADGLLKNPFIQITLAMGMDYDTQSPVYEADISFEDRYGPGPTEIVHFKATGKDIHEAFRQAYQEMRDDAR